MDAKTFFSLAMELLNQELQNRWNYFLLIKVI